MERELLTLTQMIADRGLGEAKACNDGINVMASQKAVVRLHMGKIGIKYIRELESEMTTASSKRHIFVLTRDRPTPPAQKQINSRKFSSRCSVFACSEVIRNISRHALVPRHRKIEADDIENILDRYCYDSIRDFEKLPLMLARDPMARYLGLLEGDIVEIDGCDGTTNGQKNYRRVIN